MTEHDYAKAGDEVRKYHQRLVDNVTREILAAADHDPSPDFKLDELLDEYCRKFYNVCNVSGELAAARSREALKHVKLQHQPTDGDLPAKKEPLRVATIHCSADRVTDTLNNWFANHLSAERVSVLFTQLDRGHACIVIYRTVSIYESD